MYVPLLNLLISSADSESIFDFTEQANRIPLRSDQYQYLTARYLHFNCLYIFIVPICIIMQFKKEVYLLI